MEHGTGEVSERTSRPSTGNAMIVLFATFAGGVALYFALGMPGMNHGSGPGMADMDMNSQTMTHRLVDPDEFEVAVDQSNTVVINVHQPSDGEIEGTDLFMRFDDIDPAPLPFDHATVLAIYGKSNTMSAEAAVKLAALGYTNIVELDGGIDAWQASGRPVVRAARDD